MAPSIKLQVATYFLVSLAVCGWFRERDGKKAENGEGLEGIIVCLSVGGRNEGREIERERERERERTGGRSELWPHYSCLLPPPKAMRGEKLS